ncbi:MAG: hypothetical protein JNL01_09555 [Bdellovibrionales bacterium]|nr:hypothetical protein [Bdellovibrionales bacterium]
MGFDVWIASNDRSREYCNGKLGDRCLTKLPDSLQNSERADSFALIDVLWFEAKGTSLVAAFEVEHTTSIYSGILRLYDLALSEPANKSLRGLYLVAPDEREEDVRNQLSRPAFRAIGKLSARYLPYNELDKHRESMTRFGEGLKAIEAIARILI